jgi:hypothetical protein
MHLTRDSKPEFTGSSKKTNSQRIYDTMKEWGNELNRNFLKEEVLTILGNSKPH